MCANCGSTCPLWLRQNLTLYEKLMATYTPAANDLAGRLKSTLSIFCSNLNCIAAYCWLHGMDWSLIMLLGQFWDHLTFVDSEVHDFDNDARYNPPATGYTTRLSKTCGNTCYLLFNSKDPKVRSGYDGLHINTDMAVGHGSHGTRKNKSWSYLQVIPRRITVRVQFAHAVALLWSLWHYVLHTCYQ